MLRDFLNIITEYSESNLKLILQTSKKKEKSFESVCKSKVNYTCSHKSVSFILSIKQS